MRLWIEVEFYSVACTLLCNFLGSKVSVTELLKSAIPFTTEAYWYVTAYAVLLCFCPFINKLLDCLNRKQYLGLIAVISLIYIILPTVFVWERDLITTGMDYEWFIPLYIIGGYIRKFGIPCNQRKAFVGYVLCSLVTAAIGTYIKSYYRQLCPFGIVFSIQFYYGRNGINFLVLVPFKSEH